LLTFISLTMSGNYYLYESINPLASSSTSATWDFLHGLETITTAKNAGRECGLSGLKCTDFRRLRL
jgi:hypothetical protein